MKKVVLQFKDISRLWEFAQSLKSLSMQFNGEEKKLICTCSNDEIETAKSRYGATLIKQEENSQI